QTVRKECFEDHVRKGCFEKDLLEAPFSTFLKEETVKKKTLHINQFTLKDVPHYEVKEKVIWGATAMMMSELVEVARQPAMR
ncbi:MAG: hypothetical protein AAF242_08480, partial [Bacteroidota bacterium]